ncbi:hypothetical protein HCN44_006068 [Aphidius gifuensis]|uniref:LysM domain-containing protein n=1 Tax=Aphidius gifuensis TaxID=684658 RepID=A0A834Y481_APHGI|nr:lysM and putative peptidoglycan-binding domain-containing protein 3 [Aphidius gifuensis]KAF7997497.1 hypothetical protein HCN44_006068 [Aphidius gifuensis]
MINMRKKSTSEITDKSNRPSVYQRGNNQTPDSSPHYVFVYDDDDEDNSDEETIILQLRSQPKTQPRKIEVINVSLTSDDTLQSLSLRYRCTISELKRINNIHRENEIFARRTIKVPVQPYSFLTETNATDLLGIDDKAPELLEKNDNLSNDQEIMNMKDNQTTLFSKPNDDINSVILNSICEPLTATLSCHDDVEDDANDEEDDQLLLLSSSTDSNVTNDLLFSCSGADWGLSWRQLIVVSLLLSFAGPVIYILYIAENSQRHIKT